MPVKVTMIGGGSSSFVPPLIRSFIRSEVLGDAEVTLMDVNAERVKVMEDLAGRLIESEGSALRVSSTLDRREALADADYVVVAISVGGMAAWANDIEIPARYGIVMHVADSVGPGGIFRTLRNAPVLEQVARDVAEVAPDAQIFNYTNPAPVETLALRTVPQVRSLGLCSCTAHPASAKWLASQCGVAPEDIAMPPVVAGLNHCAAVVELRAKDGTDLLPLAREHVTEPVTKWVLETYGVLPYCWSHWVEFHPQMQWLEQPLNGSAQGVKMRYGITTHDMAHERGRVQQWEDLAREWTAPDAPPVALDDLPPGSEDEGIEVIEIIEAIEGHRNEIHVVNAVNGGAIPNLPPEAVVEVNASINAYGVRPISAGPLPEPLAAHLRHYYALQQQMVKAALSGERQDALHAFLLEPTIAARLDLDQTAALLDELLEANAEHLPRFSGAGTAAP